MQDFFNGLYESFVKTFITDDRWVQLLNGLLVTLEITFFAVIIGVAIGFLIAIVRSTYDMNLSGKKCRTLSDYILKAVNAICNIYITVIRGTPVLIQLMIMYFIVFAFSRDGIIAAIISFGINSGAYVAEIVRSGIMSIDKGQFEASRSLGFNYRSTMIHVIIPQAFKNALPPLGNEVIVLIKETAIVGYVGMSDLTRVANQMTSKLYEAFMPLIGSAVIYFTTIKILTVLLAKLERRLRKSDNR